MLIRLTAVLLLSNRFSSAALFVLLAASARAWIVWIDLTFCALYRFSRAGLVFVGSGHFGYLLTFYFLLNTYMEQETDGILLDGLEHFVKHVVSCHLVLNPRENAKATGGYSYYVNTGEAAKTYSRNMDGWRDCYNLADLVLREIETAEYIAGHSLVKEQGIKFGPFTEDGNVWDYYPYWHSWISFALEIGTTPAIPKEYEEFL